MESLYERRADGDPVLDINDWANANEILAVRAEDHRRAVKEAKRKGLA